VRRLVKLWTWFRDSQQRDLRRQVMAARAKDVPRVVVLMSKPKKARSGG
jgi:hypothetical protein